MDNNEKDRQETEALLDAAQKRTKTTPADMTALNLKRTYTTGAKLGARQMFVFNEDGTIAGLKKVEPADAGAKSPLQRRNS